MVKYRNESIDILRGLAMLFVIFQHTMSGVTVGAEQSFVFNIAWSLQMPLFILISGYITKYSRPIQTLSALGKVACKKTVAYMCPWLVWTFLVRGLLLGQTSFFDLKYILWKMDSGYWFLATIWVISLIYSCASFVAEQMNSKYLIKKQIIFVGVYILGMLVLVAVGLLFGISFFAIKLTLYYMPFYYAGYLYGQCEDKVKTLNLGKTIIDVTVAICLGVWLFIVLRYSVFDMSDSGIDIIFRVFTSLAGCIAISGLVSNLFENTTGGGALKWVGVHSLEIYLSHYLLLGLIKLPNVPQAVSYQGILLIVINYLLTVGLTMMVVQIVNQNALLKRILFAKVK